MLQKFLREEEGQTLVEYGLIGVADRAGRDRGADASGWKNQNCFQQCRQRFEDFDFVNLAGDFRRQKARFVHPTKRAFVVRVASQNASVALARHSSLTLGFRRLSRAFQKLFSRRQSLNHQEHQETAGEKTANPKRNATGELAPECNFYVHLLNAALGFALGAHSRIRSLPASLIKSRRDATAVSRARPGRIGFTLTTFSGS